MEQGKTATVESPRADFESVCQKVRAAVEPARAHALSLHDETGEVLWLSESTLGPDEHNAVRQALESFANISGPAVLAYDMGDSRSAVLLRAINTRRTMVGAVMMLMETRFIKQDERGVIQLMTPQLQRALTEFAGMRPDASRKASDGTPAASGSSNTAGLAAMAPPVELSLSDSVRVPRPVVSPTKRPQPEVTPKIDRLHAALRSSPIALHVQRLVPLNKGSQLNRYEVLLRSKTDDPAKAAPFAMLKTAVENGLGSMIDRRVVTELIGWLVRHPDAWRTQAVMFSVNLTATALHDEHFFKFIELCLAKSSLPKAMIAFEIDVESAIKLGERVADIGGALHRLGCPLVLDDFGMRTECFELLRLPAVRYIKLASEITNTMRTDKLSQAAITAVVQMARVLGMHTVGKRTESAAEQEWLTALGVDFIQSNSLSPSVAIESLSKMKKAKP